MEDGALLEAIRTYHASGWKIFPVRYIDMKVRNLYTRRKMSKLPSTYGDVLFYQRYNQSPEAIYNHVKKRGASGIGIKTGKVSGIVVLDIDYLFGGEESVESLNLPKTRTVKTPHGKHLYFSYPPHANIGWAYLFLQGIDLLGDGGTATLPPSKNIDQIDYYWEDESVPIIPLPEHVVQLCKDTHPHYAKKFYLYSKSYYVKIPYHRIMQFLFGGVPADWEWKKKWTARKKNSS